MNILCLCQFYGNPNTPLNGKYYTFFEYLATKHNIHLISTQTVFNEQLGNQYHLTPPKVTASFISTKYDNKMGVFPRLISFAQFSVRAFWQGIRAKNVEVIWGVSTPLSVALVASLIARIKRVPWVFEVQDLWPDFPIQMGAINNPLLQKILYRIEHHLYRDATVVITSSPDMEAHVRKFRTKGKTVTLYHGTDFNFVEDQTQPQRLEQLIAENDLKDKKILLYGGTLGRANDIPSVLEAFVKLGKEHADIMCLLVGQGFYADLVDEYMKKYPFIRYIPPQPASEILSWFSIADVSIVAFIDKPILAANSPAKLMDSLAVGTPVVVTNPGWTKTLVEIHHCGLYVPASNPQALYEGLNQLLKDEDKRHKMGINGRNLAKKIFDRAEIARTLESIFDEIEGENQIS
jgi:glycosyltransferase involved in cell wall biosynthesis